MNRTMIFLYYSNHLEALVPVLARHFDGCDPFAAKTVVVPNRNVQMWLNLHLAREWGIAANLRFEWLDRALFEIAAAPKTVPIPDQLLQMMAIRLLRRYEREADEATASLRAYLAAGGNRDARLFQLSARLLAVFREYTYSREDMVEAWLSGEDHGWPKTATEAWQRRLWRDLFGSNGLIHERNQWPGRVPMAGFHQVARAPRESRFEPLHLFGVSYISRFHQGLLKKLSRWGDIHIYVLNPCRAFWEDIQSPRQELHAGLAAKSATHGGVPGATADNPFLQAWGRPGREYQRLLNQLGGWDYSDHFVTPEPGPRSLLNRIQADILDRQPLPDEPELSEPDRSLRVMGCAGPGREAEAVANAVWDLLLEDDGLQLRDIGIIVTDMATYQPELVSAFHRIHRIPYNLVEGVSGRAARLVEGVSSLFALAEDRFDRESVFRLYRHPNFQARFPEADVDRWLSFADTTRIFHGRDRHHQRERGDAFFDGDLYNWDQGFKRMLVGAYMHPTAPPIFETGGAAYRLLALGDTDAEIARFFFTVTQSLFRDTGRLAKLRLSASRWAQYLRSLISTYLAPLPEERADFDEIRKLAGGIAVLGEAYPDPETPLGFGVIRAFFDSELKRLKPFYGHYLADGVTISPFVPMRPIPFKTLFVMGMDESRFPAPNAVDTLDLRRLPRRVGEPGDESAVRLREPGDVSPTERDRFMFLEALLCARQRLIVSYVDRNEKTEDPVNPSSVVAELGLWAGRYCRSFGPETQPLKRYSERYRFMQNTDGTEPVSYDPFAERLALARANRAGFRLDAGIEGEGSPQGTATAPEFGTVRSLFGLEKPDLDTALEESDSLTLDLRQLRKFLECPLQEGARRVLHLKARRESLERRIREPLAAASLTQWSLTQRIWEQVLENHAGDFSQLPELAEALSRAGALAELEGDLPSGPLGPLAIQELQAIFEDWAYFLESLGLRDAARRLVFGASAENGGVSLEPLTLDLDLGGRRKRVTLTGRSQFLFDRTGVPHSVTFSASSLKSAKYWEKRLLRGFIDALAFSATETHDTLNTSVIGIRKTRTSRNTEPGLTHTYRIEPERARSYLRDLITEMLGQTHDYLLPADLVWDIWSHRDRPDLGELYRRRLSEMTAKDHSGSASGYGPLRDWRGFPAPEPIRTLIERRFSLFFEQLRVPDRQKAEEVLVS